jgi:serine/threonine protein kinase
MSPEQASGKNDELDERSDIFSLCMVFYELLTLKHPLGDKKTLEEIIVALQTQEWNGGQLGFEAVKTGAPCELIRYLVKGIHRDPAQRFQSVGEMERALQDVMDGKIPADCYITATKRASHEFMSWIDRHPFAYLGLCIGAVLLVLSAVVSLLWRGLH